ncbi:JmjC domain-containing protein [Amycolatopsis sp. NPDC051903]|uniref:JmjC domain-containing protein n=1 Tax=Amycolatopsis sp. NPDC051903 TaxID=3363936 RepID=UPI003793D8DC
MYTPTFADLVGDEAAFFERYFNHAPLLRRDALPVDPREVLAVADLDELLSHDAIRLPYLRIAKDGSSVREVTYSRTHVVQNETVADAVDPRRVHELFRSGATVTWNSINHVRPNLRDLTAMLNEKFATRSDAIAFLTPAGKRGYAPHHDPVDVFVVQLAGTKEWQLWPTRPDRRDDTGHYSLDELGEPAQRTVLRPGDVLYLPYSTPHVAAAQNEMSLHLSIVVEPRLVRDLVANTVAALLDDDPEFADFPLLDDTTEPRLAAALVHLAKRLGEVDTAEEVRRLRRAGRADGADSRRTTTFVDLARVDGVGPDARLTREPGQDLAFGDSVDGRTTLVLGSHAARVRTAKTASTAATLTVPDAVADRLRGLAPGEIVLASELYPGVTAERSVAAAKSLARLGVLAVVS